MGTRNLTLVIHKGKTRMAQYGQWDGYPDGLGMDLAGFLDGVNLDVLRQAIEKCVFVDRKTIEKYYKEAGHDGSPNGVKLDVGDTFKAKHPLLDRDYSGGKALEVILGLVNKKGPIELSDQGDFARDSLFCEWAYVLDLDKEVIEIYKGFNTKNPLMKKDRFYYLQDKAKLTKSGKNLYFPVKLEKSWPIKEFNEEAVGVFIEEANEKEEEG